MENSQAGSLKNIKTKHKYIILNKLAAKQGSEYS